ncbi:helicase [Bulinus truncatus]|nr:helicase [Bulinus truncatus]
MSHRMCCIFTLQTPPMCNFPSNHFYDSKLVTKRQAATSSKLPAPTLIWPAGDKSFPSVFLHVSGIEIFTDLTFKSYRSECALANLQEAEVVVTLTNALIQYHGIPQSSILILTATHAQATLIKDSVPKNVAVNTVMESTGQECQYVILTTVRSQPAASIEYPPSQDWISDNLGQMSDPHCINLAVTRAQAALYIIGNKDLLGTCHTWKELISVYRRRQSLLVNDVPKFLKAISSN